MEEFQCKLIFIAWYKGITQQPFLQTHKNKDRDAIRNNKKNCFDTNLDSTFQFLFIVRVGAFPTLWLTLKVSHVMFFFPTLPVHIWFRTPTLFLVLWHIISVPSGWGVARWPGISLRWRPSFRRCIYWPYFLAPWGLAGIWWSLLSVSLLRIIGRTWWRWSCLFFFPLIQLLWRTRWRRSSNMLLRFFSFLLRASWRRPFIRTAWTGGRLSLFSTLRWWARCGSSGWRMPRCVVFTPGACPWSCRRWYLFYTWRSGLPFYTRAWLRPGSFIIWTSSLFLILIIWAGILSSFWRWGLNSTVI